MTSETTVRPVGDADRDDWAGLYVAYAASGGIDADDEQVNRVWGWMRSPLRSNRCLLACAGERVVGLVHLRSFEIPILGAESLYVDDLFVVPERRGRGVARALLDAVRREAGGRGLRGVRWTTRPDNAAARALYDRVAEASDVVTYNAGTLGEGGTG